MTTIRVKAIVSTLALVFLCLPLRAGESDLLLRWPTHEGAGVRVQDTSGNGHDGKSAAGWVTNGSVQSLFFDGQAKSVVPAQAIGKDSWTFTAWLRPEVLGFPATQNQRRLFTLGKYFDASYFHLELTGTGSLTWWTICQNAAGQKLSTYDDTTSCIKVKSWSQVAVVMDQPKERVVIYVNGVEMGETALPSGWNGSFNLNNQFTLGSSWQNYLGAIADVAVWRRALTKAEVQAAFRSQRDSYGVKSSDDLDADEAFSALVEAGNAAMAKNQIAQARTIFQKLLATPGVPHRWAAWAELRIAQSHRLEGNADAAKAAYAQIQKNPAYPVHLRQEGADALSEIQRVAQGLPARDVAASQILVPPIEKFAAEIWLAPDGNDANPGTAERPVATLQRARDLVRTRKAQTPGPIAVSFKSGEYGLKVGLNLTAQDSGTADAPIVWRAEKSGAAVLYGGTRLENFSPVTDAAVLAKLSVELRGNVVQYDLRAQGITDCGALAVRGFSQPPSPPTAELYVNQQPKPLARWPNEDFVAATKLVHPGDKNAGIPSVLGYADDRHARWTNAPDGWLFGYFRFLWADATAKIGRIDPAGKTIATAVAYAYGDKGMEAKQGILYYAFNLLEELDRPGEWYLDRGTGKLYLYPPADLSAATVEIFLLAQPMISAAGISHVRFEGLVFDLARGDGIVLKNSSDCLIAGCTVQRMAGSGINILGGVRDTLLSCDIHTIGRNATEVSGGDRATLTPGKHTVANCRIQDFGRIDRTYTPGVQLEGVGNRVAHNLFYDCPSSALRIEGNDHIIEYNEVRNAVLESDDQGAMELFGNPTYRGVVFRFNSFSDIGSGTKKKLHAGQAGIRFDDAISGMLVYGNIFYRSANGNFGGVQMNSGRDNVLDNNIFVDGARGVSGGYNARNVIWEKLRSGQNTGGFYTNALYQQRYPETTNPLNHQAVNHASRNIFCQIGRDFTGNRALLDQFANSGDNDQNPGFVDAAHGNLRLPPDAPAIKATGFRPIPVDEIGTYPDAWRPPPERQPVE